MSIIPGLKGLISLSASDLPYTMYSNTTQNSLFLAVVFSSTVLCSDETWVHLCSSCIPSFCIQLIAKWCWFIPMIPWHHAALVLIHLILPIFRPHYELLRDCCFSCCSVKSCLTLSTVTWTATHQASSPSPSLRVCSNSHPLCQDYPTISASVTPSPPALNLSQLHGLF